TYVLDFNLQGFQNTRRLGIVVKAGKEATADAEMRLRAICECVGSPAISNPADVAGTIVDDKGRPIPHVRLDLRGPSAQQEQAYAGLDGEFRMLLPAGTTWTLAIGDAYFVTETRTLKVERKNDPLKIVLMPRADANFDGTEWLNPGCGCPGLFVH